MLIKWLVNLRRWETGQWSGADDNPSIVADLLQEEMQEGWIEEVVGVENKLKQRFPQVASGKLNLALAPNRSCSYLNPKSHVLAWYFRRALSARRCTRLNVLCILDIGCCKGAPHNSRCTLMTEGFYVFFQSRLFAQWHWTLVRGLQDITGAGLLVSLCLSAACPT